MAQYYRKLSKGIRWYYKFSFDRNTYFSQCIYLSKTEAKRAETDKYKELDEKRRFPNLKEDMKLSELINSRLDEIKTKKSHSYYKDNEKYLNELLDYLGDVWVNDITRADINRFINLSAQKLKDKGRKNYTPNAMIRVYKALFNFGIDNFNVNGINPCKGIKFLSIDKKLKYIPSDSEIEALKSKCDKEQIFLIDFLIQTGARINEAIRLSGKDILDSSIVLYTRKSKNSNLTPRKVPIPECFKEKKFNKDQKVFGRWTQLPKFLNHKLMEMKKSDPTIRLWGFHSLRHRYASVLSKNGTPLYEIMQKLGHSNLSTTQLYLQLLP
ncbi:MAG: tyrosine-type recombinase/integrase [Ignavibacteriaceae bacterium]